jgi:nucleoside-diphosphate-sugar epimerase
MVIGGGLISKVFNEKYNENENTIIFASGVSDSQETKPTNFLREKNLLLKTLSDHKTKQIIYFSTILVGYVGNQYYRHKKEMEDLIKTNSKNFLIFRIPQIIGENGNGNNLINYLVSNIKNGKEFVAYNNIKRSIMDVKDVFNVVNYCVGKVNNEIIYVSGLEIVSVVDLIEKIGYILNINPKYTIQEKNESLGWSILNSNIFKEYINNTEIEYNGYTERIIKNYIKK